MARANPEASRKTWPASTSRPASVSTATDWWPGRVARSGDDAHAGKRLVLALAHVPATLVDVDVGGDGVVGVARCLQLGGLDEDRRAAEMDVAARVVGVEVTVDDEVDVARRQSGAGEGIDDRCAREPHLGDVLGREVLGEAGVDQHGGLGVANDPRIDDDPLSRRDRFGRQEATDEHAGDGRGVIGR